MLFVKDNTITDPADITGIILAGDAYLVPPAGAAGDWSGKEDQIATWGGSVWSFFAPATGALYQITEGPNAGRIYERTDIPPAATNPVANGELEEDTSGYPDWALSATGTGTSVWNAEAQAVVVTAPAGTNTARAKVTFPVISGMRYQIAFSVFSLDVDPPNLEIASYTLRNEGGAADITTNGLVANGEVVLEFLAASASYSLAINATTNSSPNAAAVTLDYVRVNRIAELVADGGFASDFDEWTTPIYGGINEPWAIETDSSPPFSGNVAFATGDYSGHTQFPALEQEITGLTIGNYYRVAFDAKANWTRGTLSLAFDDAVIADVGANGSYDFYFKAAATTQNLQFPIVFSIGGSTFECTLDNVSMMAALWVAGPVAKGNIFAQSGVTCAVTSNRFTLTAIPGTATVVCTASKTSPAIGMAAASAGVFCGAQVSRRPLVGGLVSATSSMVIDTGKGVCISAHVAAASGVRNSPDNPYYTAAMAVDAITELLSASSCSCATDGCGPIQKEALGCLNAAMQRLSATGREWGFVSNVALTLGPETNDTGEIALPADVVSVRRCTFRPALDDAVSVFATFELRPLSSRHEVESYRRSSGRDLWPLTPAEAGIANYNIPIGYFTEGEDLQNGQPNGPPQLRILLSPVYNGGWPWKIDLQAHVQPPRLTCMSILDGTRLPVPHRFAETLLVPLAKYYAMANRWFRRADLAESIQNQARDALMLTGEFQPANPQAGKEMKGTAAK